MDEVDLHLGAACLVGEGVDVEFLCLTVLVHLLKERVELVERINAVKLPGHFLTSGTPHGWGERVVGILVDLGEVELQFRCHHGPQPFLLVELEDAAQHVARGKFHRHTVVVEAVVDHLRGRFLHPRHEADRLRVRAELHVDLRRINPEEILKRQPLTRDGLQEDGFRKPQPFVFEEFARGHDLATGDACEIRGEAFDLANAMRVDPLG